MRDNYRREYKKTLKQKLFNKSAGSKWLHFSHLKFLGTVLSRKKFNRQLTGESKILDLIETNKNAFAVLPQNDDVKAIDVSPHECVSNENCKQYFEHHRDCRLLVENKITNSTSSKHEYGDEIMHFFKSITPFMKLIKTTAKLKIHQEIKEMILKELLKHKINDKFFDEKRFEKKTEAKIVMMPTRISKRIVKRNRKYFQD